MPANHAEMEKARDVYHVVPNNDLKPHTEVGGSCKCGPRIEVLENGNMVIVHNSYDGREFFEEGYSCRNQLDQANGH